MCFQFPKHLIENLCGLNNSLKYIKLPLWQSMWSVFYNHFLCAWKIIYVLCWVWNFIFVQSLDFVYLVVPIFSILTMFWSAWLQLLQQNVPLIVDVSFSPSFLSLDFTNEVTLMFEWMLDALVMWQQRSAFVVVVVHSHFKLRVPEDWSLTHQDFFIFQLNFWEY